MQYTWPTNISFWLKVVTTVVSSATPIFRRGSTDFRINFEMGQLQKIHTGEFKFKGGAGHFSCSQEFHFSWCLNVSVWYQKPKVCSGSSLLAYWYITQCNNPEYHQTRWSRRDISSKSQYSCMRGSDHSLFWFSRFHWLCFFWKICDFKFTQLMFSPL